MDKSIQIDTFNRFTRVSRETIISLNLYEDLLITENKKLNLIGKSTIKQIWTRHFLDSAQVIDFIDKNDVSLVDLGSGAGFPGLIISILAKEKKIPLKVNLIEKSPKKTKFLELVAEKLKLNVKVSNLNIMNSDEIIYEEVITARAFKPLEEILKLIHNKAKNWKKTFIFLGKTGHDELVQASKNWDIKYKLRRSVTSTDSVIIEIENFKKIKI